MAERKCSDGWLAAGLSVLLVCGSATCRKESSEQEAGRRTAAVERIAGAEEAQGPQRVVPQIGPIEPRRVSFAPAGPPRLAVIEADGTVSVWQLEPPERPLCFAWIHTDAADAVFSADGQTLITAGRDGAITLWSADGRLRKQIPGAHSGGVRAVAASSEIIASGGTDGTVRLWRPDGAPRGEPLAGHAGAVLSVALSNQGDVASFGLDQTLRIWSPGEDGVHRQVQSLPLEVRALTSRLPNLLAYDPNWGWGRAVAFAPHGNLVAVAPFDAAVRLVRKDGTPATGPVPGHGGAQSPALAYGGARLVSAGHDGTLRVWRPNGQTVGAPIAAHKGPAVGVDVSPNGTLIASAGMDDAVRLWGAAGKRIAELPRRRKGRIRSMAVSPNAERIAASSDQGEVRLWSRTATALAPPVGSSPKGAAALAFSPRSDLLAGNCRGNYVCVWSMNGQPYGVPHEAFWSEITALGFTPDGRRLAGGHNYAAPVLVWDTEKDLTVAQLEGLNAETNALAFFPDGATLAAGSIALRLWKLDGSWRSPEINAHGGIIFALAISPDGNLVASAGMDGRVYLWKPDGSAAGTPLEGHVGRVNALSFTADGELLSGGEDGKLRIWSIDSRQPRRVVNVGAPILIVGGAGNLTWAGTRRWEVQFYDKDGVNAATLFVEPSSALVATGDGSYSGAGELLQGVQAFGPNAKVIRPASPSEARVEERFAAAIAR